MNRDNFESRILSSPFGILNARSEAFLFIGKLIFILLFFTLIHAVNHLFEHNIAHGYIKFPPKTQLRITSENL